MSTSSAMINIYNESQLHRTLKYVYSTENDTLEMPIRGCICDIYTKEKNIVEIQTEHLYALKPKLNMLLPYHHVTIVYPIIENNYILTLKADGTLNSLRKSPKHGTCFQLFKECISLIPFLVCPQLTITVVYIDCQTVKIDDKNGRSRRKRARIIEKILIKINKEEQYTGVSSIAEIIYNKLPEVFISRDLKQFKTGNYTSYIISFLKKTAKIIPIGKVGRSIQYKKTDAL
ncbi:MAG: hypothetical protein ACTTH8_02115 [Treponema sp.]